jgi:hypothetical protein
MTTKTVNAVKEVLGHINSAIVNLTIAQDDCIAQRDAKSAARFQQSAETLALSIGTIEGHLRRTNEAPKSVMTARAYIQQLVGARAAAK